MAPLTITRARYKALGQGHLVIHEYWREQELLGSVFTLASMADVLGLAPSTLEARYRRGNLKVWHVDIYTGQGRPVRGFPTHRLDDVVHVLQTRGASVVLTPEQQAVEDNTRRASRTKGMPLEPVIVDGEPRYTIEVLVAHTGLATSTVRKRLSRAHLLRRMVDMPPSPRGGRVRRAFTCATVDEALAVLSPEATPGTLLAMQIQKEMASVATPQPQSQPVAPLSTTCFTGTPPAPVDDARIFADIDAALGPTPTQP